MNPEISPEELDLKIEEMMQHLGEAGAERDPLLTIASELRLMPTEDFRQRLKEELLEHAGQMEEAQCGPSFELLQRDSESVPTLSSRTYSALPADPRSLFFSFLSHAAAVVLIASGIWVGRTTIVKPASSVTNLTYTPIPLGDNAPHGGGGGGDGNTVVVSHGTPPKFSSEQIVSPAIVVKSDPKLPAQPTVLGPPDVKLPQFDRIGDLISHNVVIPSNGAGSRGGVGSNSGTGIGNGLDAGVGPGSREGIGGETYRPGNGVSAPRAIYDPDPEYSDEARRVKRQGTVVLSVVVDPSGRVRDIRVARSLGMGLDEKAIEALEEWRFAPGMKDGQPVAVRVDVEVNFRLY
jgi:periplasmic protein TonB